MAILPILVAPHPVLKQKAKPVETITPEIVALMDNMVDTMYNARGIGLAAPQIGQSLRIIIVDVSEERDQPLKMVNPTIIATSNEMRSFEEGCLSFPGQYSEVKRPETITITYLDPSGTVQKIEADGMCATCIQHEIDHLDGINFVDHISSLKRNIILRKLKKIKKDPDVPYAIA